MKNIPAKIESQTVTTGSGTNVRSTSMLKGEAKKSSVENEKNFTMKYSSGSGKCSGPFGGENTH